MVSDGSDHPTYGCTFAAEVRTFGGDEDYHSSSSSLRPPITGRLPPRYVYEPCNIHIAEVIGALIALRWRRPGSYNFLAIDRSSFFSILWKALSPFHKRNKGTLSPLEARLHRITMALLQAWSPPRVSPSWF